MNDKSDQRREAELRAQKWLRGLILFGLLLPVIPIFVVVLEAISYSDQSIFEVISAFWWILVYYELLTALPFLIHAFVIRSLIRKGWRNLSKRIFVVWCGTIGLSIPYVVYWVGEAAGYSFLLIFPDARPWDLGQEIVLFSLLPFVGLVSAIGGFIFSALVVTLAELLDRLQGQ